MPGRKASWLIADVGATNVRFALALAGPTGRPVLQRALALRAASFGSFSAAAQHYLAATGAHVQGAVLAAAGRVIDGRVHMTNLSWTLDAEGLARELGLDEVRVINDLGAAAAALPALTDADAPLLWACETPLCPSGRRRCCVIGPGTGLGISGALIDGMDVRSLDTEGGHAAYAPANEREDAVLHAMRLRFGRVSWEHVACGPGLMNLLATLPGAIGEPPATSPEEILERAGQGTDARCVRAVSLFADALAAVAGDVVLMQGAWDGAYLLGSLAQAVRPWLAAPAFRARLCATGPFSDAMTRVPVRLVAHPQPVLLGAACVALSASRRVAPTSDASLHVA